MRKSDEEIIPEKAEVTHIQASFRFDKIILKLILISGICRAVFAIGALIVGFDYAPHRFYGASTEETWIHTLLYDFNYSPFSNVIFSASLIASSLLLLKRNKWGYRIYLLFHLFYILMALPGLSETQMLDQSYYWMLSGVWVILLTIRKGYMK